jgi:thiamine-phosphate pyrophosphorylase
VVLFFNQPQGDANMSAISRLATSLSFIQVPKERLSCNLSLYLVANRPSFQDEQVFFSKILAAVRGGVSCVQLRDHQSSYLTSLEMASRLKDMLGATPLFVNTLESIKLAQAINAEGIYLEEGVTPSEARSLLGERVIIGAPVKTMEEVMATNQMQAIDYLSVKVFPSKKTCPKNTILWGIEGLRKIRLSSPHRIVAIGGLNLNSVEAIYKDLNMGDGIAMAGGLMGEENPYLTAKKIQAIQENIRGQA